MSAAIAIDTTREVNQARGVAGESACRTKMGGRSNAAPLPVCLRNSRRYPVFFQDCRQLTPEESNHHEATAVSPDVLVRSCAGSPAGSDHDWRRHLKFGH